MKEHPILFSTPMVQAILEGRKTQTRRVIKPQPKVINKHDFEWKDRCYSGMTEIHGGSFRLQSPYGQPGDLLWVGENWIEDPAGKKGLPKGFCADYGGAAPFGKKKPSIHLKKKYARIWLKIKDVRVERLQEISQEDAISEGIRHQKHEGDYYYFYPCNDLRDDSYIDNPITSFYSLWRLINGIDGIESWDADPWVWVVEFEVVSTTGKPENPKL